MSHKAKRTSIKSALTRCDTYFNNIKDLYLVDFVDLSLRLSKAEVLLDDFNEVQLRVELSAPDYGTNVEEFI